jgi:N-acetylneuraminic acid mutarotase
VPTARASSAMICFDEFNKIYIFGGTDNNIKNMCANDVFVYDICEKVWKLIKL